MKIKRIDEESIAEKLEYVKGAIKAGKIEEEKESEDEDESEKIQEELQKLREEHQKLNFKLAFHRHIFENLLEKTKELMDFLQRAQTNNLDILTNTKDLEDKILLIPDKSLKIPILDKYFSIIPLS